MKKINHVFIFLEVFTTEGGIQSYVKDLLKAYLNLAQTKSYQGKVFLLRDPVYHNPYETANLSFYYGKTLPPWLGRIKLAVMLLIYLLSHRPSHVYCGHIKLGNLVRILCKTLTIPYTVITYGKEVWETLPSTQRQCLQQAHSIWTISRYSRDRIVPWLGQDRLSKVKILPCAVDGNIFTPGDKPPELLKKYALENAKVLMTVARLWPGDIYKGVDVTIRALPEIKQHFPDVKYLIIGRGGDRPRLEKLSQELQVTNQVIFAGFIPTEELPKYYQLADAYIMPSQEGFGIVYLEAMACGKPVLAGDNDGSADPLQDGKLGWQVPYRDQCAVAQACIEILQGKTSRCNSQWLREETLAKFSQEAFQETLSKIIYH